MHTYEGKFAAAIVEDLEDAYGAENVRREVVLPVTERRVDILVETPSAAPDLAIEVENDFESVPGAVGQAIQYAEQTGARPVVFVPEGHVEIPEVFHLASRGVDIFQYPATEEE